MIDKPIMCWEVKNKYFMLYIDTYKFKLKTIQKLFRKALDEGECGGRANSMWV